MSRYYRVKGCIHIHFPLNLMEKEVEIISKSAEKAGVDFAILTSHVPERNAARYEKILKFNKYYGKTLIISEQETNDSHKRNHLIIAGEEKWYGKKENIEEIIKQLNKDSLKIVVHPFGSHRLFLKRKEYKWTQWKVEFDCIEVWSLLFDWASLTNPFNLPYRYFTFPDNLRGPDEKTISKWDEISRERKITGIAGLDIHKIPFFLEIFDIKKNFLYETAFKILRNHLFLEESLSGNSEQDIKKILLCLKKGNLYFANDYLMNSDTFYFGEENGDFIMGDYGKVGSRIVIKIPAKGRITLIRNGKVIEEKEGEFLKYYINEKGNYRTVVYYNGKPWIFSNMIYFKHG